MIGRQVYETLERRKVEVEGIEECYQQCDTNFEPTQGSWCVCAKIDCLYR